jgi:endonuclease/exonuclease/phosphatase family metal-dependent hydrolase
VTIRAVQAEGDCAVRLVSLNIERSRHLDRIGAFLRRWGPDVVCLQEIEQRDLPRIINEAGLAHNRFAAMARHPDSDGTGPFGVAILSRQPIEDADILVYAGEGNGTELLDCASELSRIRTCRFAALQVRIPIAGKELHVATTHVPWTPDGQPRPFQTDAIEQLIAALTSRPTILCGDFNAPRGGPVFDRLAETWRDNIPHDVTTTLDPELHRAGSLDLVVDGLFTTEEVVVRDVRVLSGLSDHQAITAQIDLAS